MKAHRWAKTRVALKDRCSAERMAARKAFLMVENWAHTSGSLMAGPMVDYWDAEMAARSVTTTAGKSVAVWVARSAAK